MKLIGEVVNYPQFEAKVSAAVRAGLKLKPAFVSIASDWYKSNKQMFIVKTGPGKYPDLAESTKEQKIKDPTSQAKPYPIMVRSGELMDSVTNPGSPNTYREITDTHLTLGTLIPYAIYHQSAAPRSRLPYRPVLLNKSITDSRMQIPERAIKRWNRIIQTVVTRQMNRRLGH